MTALTTRKGRPPVKAKVKNLQLTKIELEMIMASLKRSKKPEITDDQFNELMRRVTQALEFAID